MKDKEIGTLDGIEASKIPDNCHSSPLTSDRIHVAHCFTPRNAPIVQFVLFGSSTCTAHQGIVVDIFVRM